MQLSQDAVENILRDVAVRPAVTRKEVFAFERELLKMPQTPLKLQHRFCGHLYMRVLHLPADAISTGMIHKYPCINLLTKGERITLINGKMERIKAPNIHITPPGHKRVSYTVSDSIFITIHDLAESGLEHLKDNIPELEKGLACNSEEEYSEFCQQQRLLS